MRDSYQRWLELDGKMKSTQVTQMHRVRKVEEHYGSLDDHYAQGTLDQVISALQYSTQDERDGKPNPSKIVIDGNVRSNLQSYKNAVGLYRKFLITDGDALSEVESQAKIIIPSLIEETKQRFTLERDMQIALRRDIQALDDRLRIVDNGDERSVHSGLIDITCEDVGSLVVIELKAGTADSRAIGQILGYMGDLQEEEPDKTVRGILVAHDFDKRARSAARVVPTLTLMRYAIEFKFTID